MQGFGWARYSGKEENNDEHLDQLAVDQPMEIPSRDRGFVPGRRGKS
jgi:hypothetical protein